MANDYSPLAPGSSLRPLEDQLNEFPLVSEPRGCLVTIRNNTTPDREATIVAAGVWFSFYERIPYVAVVADGSQLQPGEMRPADLKLGPQPQGVDFNQFESLDPLFGKADLGKLAAGVGAQSKLTYPALAGGDYMAGPVHVEGTGGTTIPFRFSDPRKPVFKLAVGIRVLFGNINGYPPADYENYFWELDLKPLPPVQPPPHHPRIAELHLDFRSKRDAPLRWRFPRLAEIPKLNPAGGWPPIPGPGVRPIKSASNWFELAERPR